MGEDMQVVNKHENISEKVTNAGHNNNSASLGRTQ